ncbi:MAG: hypothetical protein MUO50_00865, partial [Longimicrobiales bacterium]|nr:hypothetical protein [Longimicrobiales bacterium]
MFKIKSFQRRVLTALMGVGLVPAALLLLVGTLLVRAGISFTGSAGPWGSLAESGQLLLDAVVEAEISDPAVIEAARTHREALSRSFRQSQIFEVVADRILTLLPLLALGLAVLIAGLSYWVARQLSRGFSRPIQDLVGWTELIGKIEALPPPGPSEARGVQEFALLRTALRTMERELEEGRHQALQAAKLRSWTDMARRVAHELKNPLTPMRMAAGNVSRLENPTAQEAGAVLLEEIARLDEMARTFSQFGKMPEGPRSEVDIAELLQLLVQQHEGVGPVLTFQTLGGLPLITAHYDALLRCFRNLLLNAIDAAGDKGRVEVRAWLDGEWMKVEIQ